MTTPFNFEQFKSLFPEFKNSVTPAQYQEYFKDFSQRYVLFMDTMRKRGNEMLEMTNDNHSTVLNFKYEKILLGTTFDRPINYWLAKVLPPEGVVTDDNKRPYVIQDPRAGQGPGIGGFKSDSEIGDALRHGSPVYFVGFNSKPVEGQTYEDVIKGQLKLYEKIDSLHPNSPKMCAIGNCAAGYLTMFNAMQRPDIFGPILIAGSPLSYWNGERGKNAMRYAGGMVGGSWINSLLGDLGGGKFDGTYLILNFDLLNPANFLWSKQYDLFANIDKEGERYLQFEKWWGDFIQFNTPEIRWLVDKLFIGNELTTGNLMTVDGIRLDPRNITSPIITFVSDGDNISPPAQSAGWIADLYKDTDEIISRGKTIVYCLNNKVGHLAIFTAAKVGKREHEVFVENMDSIDVLPPGLYELIIDTPEGEEIAGKLQSHYEPRTIDDIKALGWNSREDDRAFATVAKASEATSMLYDKFIHPWFNMFSNPQMAENLKTFRPLRLSYSLFAEKFNPFMSMFAKLAPQVEANRVEISNDNPLLEQQRKFADKITKQLEDFTNKRDKFKEHMFFNIWSNKWLQKYWGTDVGAPRYIPSETQFDRALLKIENQGLLNEAMTITDDIQAMVRLVIIVISNTGIISEYLVRELVKEVKEINPKILKKDLNQVIKMQTMVVRHDRELAIQSIKEYLEIKQNAHELFAYVQNIRDRLVNDDKIAIPEKIYETRDEILKKIGIDVSSLSKK